METCPHCGFDAPGEAYCVRCGGRLAPDHPLHRRGFAAAPHEHVVSPRLVSTIFPHLPSAGMETFRVLLVLGAALIAALGLAGLYPVALIAAAVLVPLLVVFYFWEVDLYEDEPLRVLALTVVWGAGCGVGVGFLADAVRNGDAALVSQTTGHAVLWNGVLIPLIGFVLVLAGPLALLRFRKFDDVLDGVTFGGACAVSFAGAELLTHSSTLLGSGLEPAGLVTPWVLRLLTLGFAVPVLAAAVVGGAAGALWLRYRAPRRDRERLKLLGHPGIAVVLAAGVLVAAALLQLYLGRWPALAALAALAAAALVWLRQLIHLGLIEEAVETEIGPPRPCPNCHRQTPWHTFCAHCGVSLRALPKSGRPHLPRARARLLARFSVGLALLVGLAAGVMAAAQPGPARSPCTAGQACASPPHAPVVGAPSAKPATSVKTWRSALGVRLTYDANAWRTEAMSDRRLRLNHADDLELEIDVSTADLRSLQQLLADREDALRGRYADLELDANAAHQPASAAIGSVSGLGAAFAGHDTDGRPVEALIEASVSGNLTVVVSAWTTQQAHTSQNALATPFDVLANADRLLETFRWPGSTR